jgi:hypothetical protein
MSFFYLVFNSILLALTIHTEIPFSNVEKAFASADASGITAIGKERMMLNILGKEAVYSQSQATMILNDGDRSIQKNQQRLQDRKSVYSKVIYLGGRVSLIKTTSI